MGRYIEQTESQSELQQRIAADLRAKAAARAKQEGTAGGSASGPDGINDSAYIQGTKQTTTLSWAWLLISVLAIGVFIYFVYLVNK